MCRRFRWRRAGAPTSSRFTRQGDIWIIEIKSSIEDFRVDRKWPEYRLHSDRFFFATHPEVARRDLPRGLRLHPLGRLWRRKSCVMRLNTAGSGHPQGADAAFRAAPAPPVCSPPELAGVAVPALEGESE